MRTTRSKPPAVLTRGLVVPLRIRVHGVAPHDLTWQLGVRQGRPSLMVTHGDRYLEAP